MTKPPPPGESQESGLPWPLKILVWPFMALFKGLYEHWLSYLHGKVLRDEHRIYSVRFIWYGDSVYLHPMIWGSLILFFVAKSGLVGAGWPLLMWFILLALCILTVIYDFDIFKTAILLVCVAAVFGLAYISKSEWEWNPFGWVRSYVQGLDVSVSDGFYIASAWVFALLISAEVIWAWLFNRVELDESYVYERRFLRGTSREPIFARGLKRETKDLLELLIMGAGDIQHRTRSGIKEFRNVPGVSLGLGRAIDSMLDHRRPGEMDLRRQEDDSDQVMPSDAAPGVQDQVSDDGINDDDPGTP
ncbi:MAG: hypothetical protein R6U98_16080 [Pirellulaceae bacterium]